MLANSWTLLENFSVLIGNSFPSCKISSLALQWANLLNYVGDPRSSTFLLVFDPIPRSNPKHNCFLTRGEHLSLLWQQKLANETFVNIVEKREHFLYHHVHFFNFQWRLLLWRLSTRTNLTLALWASGTTPKTRCSRNPTSSITDASSLSGIALEVTSKLFTWLIIIIHSFKLLRVILNTMTTTKQASRQEQDDNTSWEDKKDLMEYLPFIRLRSHVIPWLGTTWHEVLWYIYFFLPAVLLLGSSNKVTAAVAPVCAVQLFYGASAGCRWISP